MASNSCEKYWEALAIANDLGVGVIEEKVRVSVTFKDKLNRTLPLL